MIWAIPGKNTLSTRCYNWPGKVPIFLFGQLYLPQGPDDDQRGRKTEEAGGKKTKGTGQGSKAEKIAPELLAFRFYFLTLFYN
jgi:hypothetical protein